MTDRELLELAAKAVGLDVDFDAVCLGRYGLGKTRFGFVQAWWNPLIDDGDALRLAVALGLKVDIGRGGTYMEERGVRVYGYESRRDLAAESATDNGAALLAATRLAILRAAAKIGKAMP